MTRPGRRFVIAAGTVAALIGPGPVDPFTLLQPARHWAAVPVQLCVNSPGHRSITANDPDGGVTATTQALNNAHPLLGGTGWNVTSVGTVVNAAGCTSAWRLGDGTPSIAFTEMIKGTCKGSCLAATFTGFYHCDPALPDGHCVIDDADVETRSNKSDKFGGPYYSLHEPCTKGREWNIEAIMVHEVGHVLGLGHSDVAGSTMAPSLASCTADSATPSADDAAALDALY
jgi:hypothetical protein